tara:strand:- start:212 stop:1054 length:843 start_codon:yes stop_codon:yes gene_type:complete
MCGEKIQMPKNKNIQVDNLELGSNVIIEPSAVIRGANGKASRVIIGDNTYIGADVQIICDDITIGDYCKIHHHTNIHGHKPCKIGHNAWIGQYCIIDTIGGTTIGNNCGIGAHSQLWSHIKYGDTLEGCRFLSDSPLSVGNDVWFVGHCIVSPITAADKSMALVGSVITGDMKYNHVYAGTPAKDLTDKIGHQFADVSVDQKYDKMCTLLKMFDPSCKTIKIVKNQSSIDLDNTTMSYFDVNTRTYTKRKTDTETAFMKYLLPDKGKFVPLALYNPGTQP